MEKVHVRVSDRVPGANLIIAQNINNKHTKKLRGQLMEGLFMNIKYELLFVASQIDLFVLQYCVSNLLENFHKCLREIKCRTNKLWFVTRPQ